MPADDFALRIALDALRAGVPARDDAARIEHVEGVIGDPFDEPSELLLAFAQGRLGLVPPRAVAGDLGEAQQGAALVADRLDHGRGPEAAAILAHPPAFALGAAFRLGLAQKCGGSPTVAILGRKETRKILADDFAGSIPGDPLRAKVPADYDPVCVEHDDRMIGECF